MPLNNSRTDDENDVLLEVDDYRDSKTATVAATGTVGATAATGETLDRVGTAANEFDGTVAASVGTLDNNFGGALGELDHIEADDDSPMKWITPLILLALLVAAGSWFCGKA